MSEFWEADPIVSAPKSEKFWEADPVVSKEPVSPVTANDVVRSAAEGISIGGGLLNKADAATNAALAPILNRFFDPKDQLTEPTWGERYAHSLKDQEGASKKFAAEHPVVDTTAKVAGGIGSMLPLAATKLGAKALGLVGETLPAQMAAGAASGAGIGALDAAARGEDVLKGAVTTGGFGAAGPVAGRLVGKVVQGARDMVGGKPTLPSSEEIKDAATAAYDRVRNMDVQLKPQAIQTLAQDVQQKLTNDGLRDYLAPKTFATLNELSQPAPNGAVATFADLHGIRRALGKAAASPDPTEKGAATTAIRALDNYLTAIPSQDVIRGDANLASQIFKKANADYSASKRADLLQGKVADADLQAASSHSGANVDNALRQRVKDILKSPSQLRGFSQDEILQMQRIVRGTAPGNVVRAVGNLLGGGGGLGSLLTAGAGAMAAGPVGLAAPIAGTIVKKIGNRMTENQVNKLADMIRARAPASGTANTAIAQALMEAQQRLAGAGRAGIVAGASMAPAFAGQSVR